VHGDEVVGVRPWLRPAKELPLSGRKQPNNEPSSGGAGYTLENSAVHFGVTPFCCQSIASEAFNRSVMPGRVSRRGKSGGFRWPSN